jgi:LacI family transcriptional regulator
MATIADIARIAGVSSSTVSHVINQTRYVSPEKKQAVEDAIAKSGYTPNTLARALASSSTNSVGIAISGLTNPYFSDIIRAIENQCTKLGMTVFLADTHDDPGKELDVVKTLHQRRVDGIILASASSVGEQRSLDYLRQNAIPTVLVDRLAASDFDQVGVENGRAMEILVSHLVAQGHRRIGFLPGQPGFATTIERTEGFRKSLQLHDLEEFDGYIAPASSDVDAAAHSIGRMMGLPTPPTGLVSGNNLATIGTMRGLRRLCLSVPKDVALVGFDDFEWADCFEPRLTVVAQPCPEIGLKAATMLLARIKDPAAPPRTVRLKTKLIVRNSCGSA